MLDIVEEFHDLAVLPARHGCRDEDAEMPDALVHQSDDHLPVGLEILRRRIEVGNPVEGLLRRGDVVAERGEQDDRRADRPQIEGLAGRPFCPAGGQPVADEEVVDDPADFLAVHQEIAAPPPLEVAVARRLGVDFREEIVGLAEVGIGRIERLEVVDQMGPVEPAAAEVARQKRHPAAAQQAARVAHRVLGIVAGPVGHGRAVHHDGSGAVGLQSAHQDGSPSALAIADDDRLAPGRMTLAHDPQELRLRPGHVGERLSGGGLRKEDHHVDGMAGAQRDADFRIRLEAADAWAVPRPRVDDHVGALVGVGREAWRRGDAHERVVRRAREAARIGHDLPVEGNERRLARRLVRQPVVAALPERVPEQQRALGEVGPIADRLPPSLGRRQRLGRVDPGAVGSVRRRDEAVERGGETAVVDLGDPGLERQDVKGLDVRAGFGGLGNCHGRSPVRVGPIRIVPFPR